MRNNNYTRPPRKGVIVFASFVFAALFIIAFIISYEQRTDLAHSVHLSPTSANYGTISTIRSSSLAVPMHSTAPLLSSGTIHAYAYSGHATMPSTGSSSGFRIHTLSSAAMHSYGSGGGGGGGAISGGSSSSSRGISYSGGGSGLSMSMPTLAVNSSLLATSSVSAAEASAPRAIGPRRAKPTDPGTDGEWSDAGAGDGVWYRWDDWAGKWVTPEEGDTRIEGGVTYEWNGTSWDPIGDQGDPTNPQPLGTTPWLLMILLTCVYALGKNYVSYSKYEKIS